MRVGIVGAGYISGFHIDGLKPLPKIELAAVCDTAFEKAKALARRHNVPGAYSSAREMIREAKLDVVHVLAPPALHKDTAIECLESGVHVFLEKPAAVNTAETGALLTAAERANRLVGVNHNAVFNPAFQHVLAGIRAWRFGKVQHVTACVNVPLRQLNAGQHGHWMFRRPGNIILEQAPHPLSQIYVLLGRVKKACVQLSPPVTLHTGAAFYDSWRISLECERGTAQCFLAFGREHLENSLHVIGQDASAFIDLRRGTASFTQKTRFMEPIDNWLNSAGAGMSLMAQGTRRLSEYVLGFVKLRPPGDLFSQGMRASIRAFHEALQAGSPLPVDIEHGAAVIDACAKILCAGGFHE